MKSYFTKFGAFLLCGVMLAAVGCHDYGEDIQQVNDKVDNLDKNYAVEVEDLEKAIAELDAKYATATALQQAITDFNAGINGLKNNEIKALQDQMAEKASSSNLNDLATTVSGIETKLDELKTQFETAIADLDKTYATDAQVTDAIKEAVNTVNTSIEKINSDITNIKTALDGKADKTDLGIVDQAVKDLTNTVNGISTRLGVAEQGIKDNTAAIGKVASDLTEAQTKLNEAIATAKDDAIEAAAAAAKKQLDEATGEINKKIASITETLSKLNERLNAVEVNVKNLLRRIQKIVYKPTHADGKARLNYALLAGETLEGYDTLTYKVYPAEYADSIADAFETNKFISYDLIPVTKANTSAKLDIVGVLAEEGELSVFVKPNGLGASFYKTDSQDSYSAALVLANEGDHFSTEYTNLVADNSASKEIKMVLCIGNVEVADNYAKDYSWPFIATGESWKETLLDGLTAKFAYNNKIWSKEELKNEYGYVVNYERQINYTLSDDDLKSIVITKPAVDAMDKYVEVCPPSDTKIVSKSFMSDELKVDYVFTCSGKSLTASAKVNITASPYTLEVKSTAHDGYKISYVDDKKSIAVLDENIEVVYVDAAGNEKSLEDVKKEFPALVEKFGVTYNDEVAKLFETKGESWPVTVSLKKDENGKLLAKKENVGEVLKVKYSFEVPVLEETPQDVVAEVMITPAHYDFYLGDKENPLVINWLYTQDAEIDVELNAGNAARYSRSFEGLAIDDPEQNDVKYWALPFGTSQCKYTVTEIAADGTKTVLDPASYVINIAGNEANGVANIKLIGFAWNKSYDVQADYQLTGATASVYFGFKTVDRPRNDDYIIVIPTETINYVANYATADGDIVNAINDITKWDSILPEINRGEGFDFNKYLNDVITNNGGIENYVDEKTAADASTTGLEFVDGNLSVQTNFTSAYFTGVIGKEVKYLTKFRAAYGQNIAIYRDINFTMPKYVISASDYCLDGCYSQVIGRFQPESGNIPVTGFSVDKIYMTDVFYKITDEKGNDVTNADYLKFSFHTEDAAYSGLMVDNVLNYTTDAETIDVGANLYLVNTNGATIEVETNWNEQFANYYVKKYNPIAENVTITVPAATLLDQAGEYKVDLRKLLSLKDSKGRDIITAGVINTTNYTYTADFYGLSLEYGDAVVDRESQKGYVTLVPGAVPANAWETDCTLVYNYRSDLAMTGELNVTIPVTYKHNWGAATGKITVKFQFPELN